MGVWGFNALCFIVILFVCEGLYFDFGFYAWKFVFFAVKPLCYSEGFILIFKAVLPF